MDVRRLLPTAVLGVVVSMLLASTAVAQAPYPAAPTPARSSAPVPRSTAVSNLIQNGGFETGNFTGWTTQTDLGSWFVDTGSCTEGTYCARNPFDGAGPGNYVIYQDVTIPATGHWVLSWSDQTAWDMFGESRWQYVEVRKPGNDKVLATVYSKEFAPPGSLAPWAVHSVRMDDFRGMSVRIAFRQYIPETYTGPGLFWLDDVRLTSSKLSLDAPKKVVPGRYWVMAHLAFDDSACDPSQDLKVKYGTKKWTEITDPSGDVFFKVKVHESATLKLTYKGTGVCATANASEKINVV